MSSPGGAELLRAAGLLVDGPAVWGTPIRAAGPGVFVVELAIPTDEAPIDADAVRRWLERVPTLTLDGQRPTARQVVQRLQQFWIPAETVLFVGRARKSVASRVTALQATRLGDSRPNPDGRWLRTLTAGAALRVWWAQTDAGDEYVDELLSQFAARVAPDVLAGLPDQSVVLPFANLDRPTGEAKVTGIADDTVAVAETVAGRARAVAPAPRAPTNTPGSRHSPTLSRRRAAAAKPAPPAPAPALVSADGLAALNAELDELRRTVRPVVIERVKTARELGDLRENADYEAARNEQSFVEGRIATLEALLRTAVVVEQGEVSDAVKVGSSVVVEIDGDEVVWQIVGSSEADPAAGRISYGSPVGQALLGRRAGEQVTAQLPRGQLKLTVREVR